MSRKDVIRQILQRERDGAPLAESIVREEAAELYAAACEGFATWETALQYAGIRLRGNPKTYSQGELLREIRHLQNGLCNLMEDKIRERCPDLHAAAIKYFRTWDEALRTVGIDPQRVSKYPRCERPTPEQLIAQLIERSQRGLTLRRIDVSAEDYRFACEVRLRFGTWSEALRAAGIPKTQKLRDAHSDTHSDRCHVDTGIVTES